MAKKQNPKTNNNLTKRVPMPNVEKRSLNNKTYKKPTTDRSMPSIPNTDKKS
ncbi:hypothetical protein [Limosilactobacillus reuteri]|uniref:hypothetical protein n=1 Tax=Limosilactobacillus reuteri TaxID=1598 RepID=UPI0015C696E3|nr:hypothetical protein [Limosilactobacillus reuteri]